MTVHLQGPATSAGSSGGTGQVDSAGSASNEGRATVEGEDTSEGGTGIDSHPCLDKARLRV